MKIGITIAALLLLSIQLPTRQAAAFSSNQTPAIRIGEHNSTSYGVLTPWGGLAFDPSGNLWVADSENNRVLGFIAPFSDNMDASTVIGQPSFQATTASVDAGGLRFPMYLAFDHAGNLWVSDTRNSRVLQFREPLQSGMDASVVIGQENFTTSFSNTTQSGLSGPEQIIFDSSGNLWVADGWNGRVLEYQAPFNIGMNASLVIGEPDFSHRYCPPNQTGYSAYCSNHSILTGPEGIAFDPQGDLWVIEYGRLLEFKPPFKNGMDKSLLIQSVYPSALAFDANGNLWLSCGYCYGGGGGSVVEYRPPFNEHTIAWENGNATNADYVLGSEPNSPISSVLVLPLGLAFDSSGNLWIVDARSSWMVGLLGRVVGYDAQVHQLETHEGQVYFRNHEALLVPLSAIPFTQMDSILFSEGLFNFTIQGLPAGGSVTVTITFPHALPPNSQWWMRQSGQWIRLPANQMSISGANLTLNLTGASSNGVISMLGGPALISNSTSSTNTSTNTTTSSTNIAGFPVESIAGGIIIGLAALTILRYRRRLK